MSCDCDHPQPDSRPPTVAITRTPRLCPRLLVQVLRSARPNNCAQTPFRYKSVRLWLLFVQLQTCRWAVVSVVVHVLEVTVSCAVLLLLQTTTTSGRDAVSVSPPTWRLIAAQRWNTVTVCLLSWSSACRSSTGHLERLTLAVAPSASHRLPNNSSRTQPLIRLLSSATTHVAPRRHGH